MYEGIKKLKADLEAQKAEVEKVTAPLHVEADKVRAQIAPLETKLRSITKEIKRVETDGKLRDLSMEIAACARALPGNRNLVNEGAAKPTAPTEA